MIQRILSVPTMERFLNEFKKKCDSLKQDGHEVYLLPEEVARILEAINFWEIWRQQQFALSFYDKAKLYPVQNVFPNTESKPVKFVQCDCGVEIEIP